MSETEGKDLVPYILGMLLGLFLIGPYLWMFLWNVLVAGLFDGPFMQYWHGVAFNFALYILRKSFGRG